jgi:hypothetical protein
VSGWNAVRVEAACDLTEAPSLSMLLLNSFHEAARHRRTPAGWPPRQEFDGGDLGVLLQESLELADGNHPRAPGSLDCVEHGNNPAVERCDAYAECLGGLLPCEDERLDSLGGAELLNQPFRVA